jgi:hypothetical protein
VIGAALRGKKKRKMLACSMLSICIFGFAQLSRNDSIWIPLLGMFGCKERHLEMIPGWIDLLIYISFISKNDLSSVLGQMNEPLHKNILSP